MKDPMPAIPPSLFPPILPNRHGMLAVGDLVGCGISHPCTTFDRWPLLLAVDDDYTVRFALNTFF